MKVLFLILVPEHWPTKRLFVLQNISSQSFLEGARNYRLGLFDGIGSKLDLRKSSWTCTPYISEGIFKLFSLFFLISLMLSDSKCLLLNSLSPVSFLCSFFSSHQSLIRCLLFCQSFIMSSFGCFLWSLSLSIMVIDILLSLSFLCLRNGCFSFKDGFLFSLLSKSGFEISLSFVGVSLGSDRFLLGRS